MTSVRRIDECGDSEGQNVIRLIVCNRRNIENPVSCSTYPKNKIRYSYAVYYFYT